MNQIATIQSSWKETWVTCSGLCAMKSILAHPTILGFSYPNTTAIEPLQEVARWGYISQTLLVPPSGLFAAPEGLPLLPVWVYLHVCLFIIHETHLPNTSSLTPQNCLYLVDAHRCCHIWWQKHNVPFRSRCAFAPIKISCSGTSLGLLRSTEWSKPWAFCPLGLLGDSTHSCLNASTEFVHATLSSHCTDSSQAKVWDSWSAWHSHVQDVSYIMTLSGSGKVAATTRIFKERLTTQPCAWYLIRFFLDLPASLHLKWCSFGRTPNRKKHGKNQHFQHSTMQFSELSHKWSLWSILVHKQTQQLKQ